MWNRESIYPGESEPQEFYMSVLLNRETGKNIIMYSTEGGMDIETVAEKTPHLIFKEEIDPGAGILPFQARRIAFNLGLSGQAFKEMVKFATGSLYRPMKNLMHPCLRSIRYLRLPITGSWQPMPR